MMGFVPGGFRASFPLLSFFREWCLVIVFFLSFLFYSSYLDWGFEAVFNSALLLSGGGGGAGAGAGAGACGLACVSKLFAGWCGW